MIVYGDEQFVSRLFSLLRQNSMLYGHILPFPGLCQCYLTKKQ